ncbi:MAG: hypothetical protein AB7O80_17105 [Acetobacteraceae bacterium]
MTSYIRAMEIPMIHPLDVPRFSIGRVANAAAVPAPTLSTNLRRGDIALAGNESPTDRHPGTGQHRIFSTRRALHIALTVALTRSGMAVRQASRLALAFTDHNGGDTAEVATIDDGSDIPMPERMPGKLYRDGTVFRVLVAADGEPIASVDRVGHVTDPFMRDNRRYLSVVMVDLDALCGSVLLSLGLPADLCR